MAGLSREHWLQVFGDAANVGHEDQIIQYFKLFSSITLRFA